MKRVADHLSDVLEAVRPLAPIDVQLLEAWGTVAAEDVTAPWSIPARAEATVAGYAVRADDVTEPTLLAVVADASDSHDELAIGPGLSVRVRPGSALPAGADAVVPVADTDGGLAQVQVHRAATTGEGVRLAGADVAVGDTVLRSGTPLHARQIGVLAAVGKDRVVVRPRPRVVLLSVGSELVEPGLPVGPGQRTDTTSMLLTAAAREAGAVTYRLPPVEDDAAVLRRTISDQLVRADLVLVTGGLADPAAALRQALPTLGTVAVVEVAVQPGGLQGFGMLGEDDEQRVPCFVLPGGPVAAYVAFEVFVRPVVRRMLGSARIHRPSERAVLDGPVVSPAGVRQFARARVHGQDDDRRAEPMGSWDVPHITDLARANALVVVPETVTRLEAGAEVDCLLLDPRRT
jgi:molybdopterin molybdotransferase